jgi:hypothetical protein
MNGSANSASISTHGFKNTFATVISYIPLFIILMALVGNTICFTVFTFNEKLKEINSMVYLTFVSITDTLSLFVWNLDHFLEINFKYRIEYVSLFSCKFFVFLQYFSLQSSALLLSILTIDRCVTVATLPGSYMNKLPFKTRRNSFVWSVLIIAFLAVINGHILILNGVIKDHDILKENIDLYNTSMQFNNELVCYLYPNGYRLFPDWEIIHLILYSAVPSVIMCIFNSLLIFKSLSGGKSQNAKRNNRKMKLTISLVIITALFLVMTLPSSIAFAFFNYDLLSFEYGNIILKLLDFLSFLNRSTLFISCYLTNVKFKKIINKNILKVIFYFRK